MHSVEVNGKPERDQTLASVNENAHIEKDTLLHKRRDGLISRPRVQKAASLYNHTPTIFSLKRLYLDLSTERSSHTIGRLVYQFSIRGRCQK